MWSVLASSWRVVVLRAVADRVILAAALITILLATMLVAAGPIYADAVSLSAVRRTLVDAEVQDGNAVVTSRVTPQAFVDTNERASTEIMSAFRFTGGSILRRGTSDSYALPEQPGNQVTELTVFRFFDQIEEHATLVDGAWPVAGGVPYEVAIAEPVAATLGLSTGDELELTNRRDDSAVVNVKISGIYTVDDAIDPFWYGDELDINGIDVGSSFTTHGPFVVSIETFFNAMTPFSSEVNWRVYPVHDNLIVGEVDDLRRELERLEGRLNADRAAGNRMRVETGLIQILREAERSLLVTRSSVLIITVQLAVLAGYALLLTAGLLVESRQVETNLLRSRGGSSTQILAMAILEGLLLTVPAALVAPWLAAWALRMLNVVGPLADIDLVIVPVVTRASYIVAGLAALGALFALTVPAYRAAQRFGDIHAQRSREAPRGIVQRAGIDIALLVIAFIGIWQLRRFGAPITETVQGRLGIDPLLIATPALGLLAGGVVALRTLPLISRFAESVTSRSTLLVPALGAWQVARRPLRYARAALLLVLATGIGLFAVSYATTWRTSQDDQAGYQIGADLRIEPDRRVGTGIPAYLLRDAYEDIPGFNEVVPVQREFGQLARSVSTVRYVILDAERAADVVIFRPDLAGEPFDELMSRIAAQRARPVSIPLPGEPARIAVEALFLTEPIPPGTQIPEDVRPSRLELNPSIRVVLVDGDGQLFRVDLGGLEQSGERERVEADLTYALSDGGRLDPVYPLAVIAIELRTNAPQDIARNARFVVGGVLVSPDAEGDAWQPVPIDLDPEAWEPSVTQLALAVERPSIAVADDESIAGLAVDVSAGATTSDAAIPLVFGFQPAGSEAVESLPVLASADLLVESGLEVGDELPLPSLPGYEGSGLVVGVIEDFPTVDPERGEPVVIDYQSYLAASFTPGAGIQAPDEYWFSIQEDQQAEAAEVLLDAPLSSADIASRSVREASLNSDPVALGTIGSLMLGFVAAAVFAGIGFAVNAAVSARERLLEFALLRAVGLSNRQLLAWLSLENALLVVFGLVAGTLLGVALAWLVLPLLGITQQAAQAVPSVIVVYPWQTIFWLEMSIVVVLLLAVGLLAVMLRRMGLGALLRLGEE